MLPIDQLRSGVRTTLLIVTVAALLFVGTACGGSSDDASTETTVAAPPVETSSTSLVRTTTTKTNPFTAIKATSSTLTTGPSTADASPGASDPASPGSSLPNVDTNGDDPSATSQPATQTTSRVTTTQQVTITTRATTATTRATTTTTVKPTTTTARAAVVLTVVGPSGTKQLSMADLKAMPAVSGYGGWKNQLGNITAPVAWKGVSIKALMDLVGGAGSVGVIASDGYNATLSTAELSGQTNLYDPSTGDAVSQISGGLRVIVAYAKNGAAISSGEGPLRIAFVSPQKDQVTDSDQWVKKVTEMRAK